MTIGNYDMPDLLRADFLSISGSQKESAKAPLQTSSSEFKLVNHFSPPSVIDFRMLRIFFSLSVQLYISA